MQDCGNSIPYVLEISLLFTYNIFCSSLIKYVQYGLVFVFKLGETIYVSELYCKTSNRSRTLVCNKIVDYSDVVGAAPVGATPTTSSYLT